MSDTTTKVPLAECLRPIQDRFCALRKPGAQPADKGFFDELSRDS